MNTKDVKNILTIILGNIFDYYDFLLFAHLGAVITAFFIEESSSLKFVSLLLFAMPFLSRPIGGYLFGKIADLKDRQCALQKTIGFASFASLAIALLPSHHSLGFASSILFFILRSIQGISLGGEYTTAGTFLMEKYKERQGLISGIFCASGTVGSLIAFCFSWIYIKGYMTGESWRLFFLLGSLGGFVGLKLRKKINSSVPVHSLQNITKAKKIDMALVFLIGSLVSILCFIPMVYANTFLTKICNHPTDFGLKATFISLILYIIFNPLVGILSDKIGAKKTMTIGSLGAIVLCWIGFYLLINANLLGQFFLISAAALFGAPIHVLMNDLFPVQQKSRLINTFFMIGGSVGGLAPFLSAHIADSYHLYYTPVILVTVLGVITFFVLKHRFGPK